MNRRDLPGPAPVRAFARAYLDYVSDLLGSVDERAIEAVIDVLVRARDARARIFVLGNGGSAATANHLASDLSVGLGARPFDATSLAANATLLTAASNDFGFDAVFVRQLEGRLRPGDVVLAMSASGRSTNVLEAVRHARAHGCVTVGFTGFDGGELRQLVDVAVHVPTREGEYGPTEDVHVVVQHVLLAYLRLYDGGAPR